MRNVNASKKRKPTPKKFQKKMQKKLILMFLVITIMMVGLIGRLMYIEYTSGSKYEKIVLAQQEYDSRIIPFQRGDILDTKGSVLATSIDVYNIILDTYVLSRQKDKIDGTITALMTCFPELNESDIRQFIEDYPDSQYRILLKELSYDSIQPFILMQNDIENYPNVSADGIWFEKEYQRTYPYQSLAASVIGFVSDGNVGTIGLENYYDSTLNGLDGRTYGYLNSDNNFEKTTKAAIDGSTIVGTIDVNIQSVVEEKIAAFNERNTDGFVDGDGSKNTGVIVMNPNTGEVLAMANYPFFDLNDPRDLSTFATEEEIAAMSNEEQMDRLNEIWQNYCVTSTFEPGSTVKPFTVAAGLETAALSGGESYYCDGSETISGSQIRCVNRSGHGMETIEQAIMDSCNDALMQMSYSIGVENFSKYQSVFGFGEQTGIDLPGEASTNGLLYSEENMTAIDLATNSFGQNFNVTMIQVASAFSSLINGGYYYEPHLIKEIQDADGNLINKIEPLLLKKTVSESISELEKEYLYATVSEGTAKTAKVPGFSMGGKTGTAQKLPRSAGTYLVSFIGYAPQENPQLVIYVVVDEPNVEEQAHSTYAQNIARDILEEILPYMNIYQDEEITEAQAALYAELKAETGESIQADGTTDTDEASASQTTDETTDGTADGTAGEDAATDGESADLDAEINEGGIFDEE
ncbi:MAG: peptidoglycan D,D-transpeptidase FtsI family protein [Lachnospiraceae bacterium]